jgi:hypothetical protein
MARTRRRARRLRRLGKVRERGRAREGGRERSAVGEWVSRRVCGVGEYVCDVGVLVSRRVCDAGEWASRRVCDGGVWASRRVCAWLSQKKILPLALGFARGEKAQDGPRRAPGEYLLSGFGFHVSGLGFGASSVPGSR